jgi:hypothetical protein
MDNKHSFACALTARNRCLGDDNIPFVSSTFAPAPVLMAKTSITTSDTTSAATSATPATSAIVTESANDSVSDSEHMPFLALEPSDDPAFGRFKLPSSHDLTIAILTQRKLRAERRRKEEEREIKACDAYLDRVIMPEVARALSFMPLAGSSSALLFIPKKLKTFISNWDQKGKNGSEKATEITDDKKLSGEPEEKKRLKVSKEDQELFDLIGNRGIYRLLYGRRSQPHDYDGPRKNEIPSKQIQHYPWCCLLKLRTYLNRHGYDVHNVSDKSKSYRILWKISLCSDNLCLLEGN